MVKSMSVPWIKNLYGAASTIKVDHFKPKKKMVTDCTTPFWEWCISITQLDAVSSDQAAPQHNPKSAR
jgi:hypothetical protein